MGIWSGPIALERAEEIASKISTGMICLNSNCGPGVIDGSDEKDESEIEFEVPMKC